MRTLSSASVAVFLVVALAGCDQQPTPPDASRSHAPHARSPAVHPDIPVVNVTATSAHADGDAEHRFRMDQTELSAGWTTFRFSNQTDVTHFMVLQKLPEAAGQVTREEYIDQVSETTQEFLDRLFAGDPDAGQTLAELPSWISDVRTMGGPGLTAGGHTSVTTLDLEPGQYVAECYVRAEETNVQHSANGMVEVFTVTDESSGAPEPAADMEVAISQGEGITIRSDHQTHSARSDSHRGIRPGKHTIAVHFDEQTSAYPGLSGHDVHFVALDPGADLDALDAWMFWLTPDGLRAPAPAGATFIGGTQQMPQGETAYVTTRLPAGEYALVAEVPGPLSRDMLKTIRIPTARADAQ